MARGECQAIDVREPAETAAERIDGVRAVPLSAFGSHAKSLRTDQPVYVVCRTGRRATAAAERLAALGHEDVRILQDGLMGWVAAGLPVERGAARTWSLERQVRFAAGSLVLLGTLLSALVHPAFVALSGVVGAGLVFAAVTDTCGMAMVLARMPWNQRGAFTCDVPESR